MGKMNRMHAWPVICSYLAAIRNNLPNMAKEQVSESREWIVAYDDQTGIGVSEPDAAKVILYEYVRDQHDKLIGARQGQKVRANMLVVLVGFLIAALCAFALPAVGLMADRASAAQSGWAWLLALLPFVPLGFFLYYLTRSVREIFSLLGHVGIAIIDIDGSVINSALAMQDVPGDDVIRAITDNYLGAIRRNDADNYRVGGCFGRCMYFARRATGTGLAVLLVTFAARVLLAWQFPISTP